MKKKLFATVTSLVLVVAMLMGLCACGSTWGSIKSAYEKEGYHEVNLSDTIKQVIQQFYKLDEDDIEEPAATLHFMTKAEIGEDDNVAAILVKLALPTSKTAVIFEYKDLASLEKAYKEDLSESEKEKADELWANYQKLDTVNGNCTLLAGDGEIFKGTK